jgi:hypothetical protein
VKGLSGVGSQGMRGVLAGFPQPPGVVGPWAPPPPRGRAVLPEGALGARPPEAGPLYPPPAGPLAGPQQPWAPAKLARTTLPPSAATNRKMALRIVVVLVWAGPEQAQPPSRLGDWAAAGEEVFWPCVVRTHSGYTPLTDRKRPSPQGPRPIYPLVCPHFLLLAGIEWGILGPGHPPPSPF